MLAVRAVSHHYAGTAVLAETDFELTPNEHCALIGASGVGKTTLLHVLAGILRPSAGIVVLDGEVLYPERERDDRWRAVRIGVIPQMLHLLPSLSALDNVRQAQYMIGKSAPDVARNLLDDLSADHRWREAQQLSVDDATRRLSVLPVGGPRIYRRSQSKVTDQALVRAVAGRLNVLKDDPYGLYYRLTDAQLSSTVK